MRRTLTLSALTLGLALGTAAAGEIRYAQRDAEFPQHLYTCRLNGEDVPLGEQRCLATPQGRKIAECGISLNMSTWRPSSTTPLRRDSGLR